MLKAALIAAALAITVVCGIQIGWVVSHSGVTQVSDHAASAKSPILKTDGGGGM